MGRPKLKPNILPATQEQQPIATQVRDTKEDAFLSLLFEGWPVKEAALKAGYSESTAISSIYSKFKTLAFQDKIRDYAVSHNARSIPKVCDLYTKTIDTLHKEVSNGNLDNMAKLKHIPRQILEIGRILTPESGHGVNMVHIDSLQMIVNGKFGKKPEPTDGSAE